MSKLAKSSKAKTVPGFKCLKKVDGIEAFELKRNGLKVLFKNIPDTGVVTSYITYAAGARDEKRGETGIAHMLEHMLFKPTRFDVKNKIKEGSAMHFERETGCIINANTWRDRTNYYFSYPAEHLDRAIRIEAERMIGVILTEKALAPERNNVLSEFDMYFGDPYYALEVSMRSAAYVSHPYGHETIGFREDIEDFTSKKLERFYHDYYRPDNATVMIVGDVDRTAALKTIKKHFSNITNPEAEPPRYNIREPEQEGLRRVQIERVSTTNIVAIGYKMPGFPSKDWWIHRLMLSILTNGPESVLHTALIDSGKASSVEDMLEPASEENLALLFITLAPNQSPQDIEHEVFTAINSIDDNKLTSLIKKAKAGMLTDELFARNSSFGITRELAEYVAAGQWEAYTKTPVILKEITTADIKKAIKESFIENNMTIGHFIGKQ